MDDRDRTLVGAAGAAAAVVVALCLVPLRSGIHPANAALVLMLVVIASAALGGRAAGVATAVAAALSFNFFFTEPYLTLRMADAGDAVTFALLLLGGLAVGQLADVADRRGRDRARRDGAVRRLHELADLAAHGASAEVVLDRTGAALREQLGLRSCEFVWGAPAGCPPDLDHGGALVGPLRRAPGGFVLPEDGLSLPVTAPDGHVVGRFVLRPDPGRGVAVTDRQLALVIADLVGPWLAAHEPEERNH